MPKYSATLDLRGEEFIECAFYHYNERKTSLWWYNIFCLWLVCVCVCVWMWPNKFGNIMQTNEAWKQLFFPYDETVSVFVIDLIICFVSSEITQKNRHTSSKIIVDSIFSLLLLLSDSVFFVDIFFHFHWNIASRERQ